MSDNLLKSYTDIVSFVQQLPGSPPPGGVIDGYNHLDPVIDPRVLRELNAKDALYIMDKYIMNPIDRRKIIAAILNVRITS
jgi:hypothetical protein